MDEIDSGLVHEQSGGEVGDGANAGGTDRGLAGIGFRIGNEVLEGLDA